MASEAGKGSSPRPYSVSHEEYSKRWDAIFQRDLVSEEDAKAEDEEFARIERERSLK
jgi:hypothetical protein